MKLYFAGIESQEKILLACKPKNVLFSFASANKAAISYALSDNCESYLLDSGAFTFMNGKSKIDFDSYVDRYIEFINQYKVKNFFEMDIDAIVGLKKVEEYRKRIERKTGRQCIPVFHRERGKQYFLDMCKEYSYVAVGGIAIKDISKSEHKYFPWFINTAHEHGCKIHGLGYTDFAHINEFRFDTVDSTTWLNGGKFGNMITIRDGYPKQTSLRKEGYRIKGAQLTEHNMRTVMKYAETLERYGW